MHIPSQNEGMPPYIPRVLPQNPKRKTPCLQSLRCQNSSRARHPHRRRTAPARVAGAKVEPESVSPYIAHCTRVVPGQAPGASLVFFSKCVAVRSLLVFVFCSLKVNGHFRCSANLKTPHLSAVGKVLKATHCFENLPVLGSSDACVCLCLGRLCGLPLAQAHE